MDQRISFYRPSVAVFSKSIIQAVGCSRIKLVRTSRTPSQASDEHVQDLGLLLEEPNPYGVQNR